MKSKLALCALMLSGSLFVAAQQPSSSSPSSNPPSTPSTFPSDQQAPTATQPQPDVNAPAGQTSSQAGSQTGSMDQGAAAGKSIEGCLSQAPSGSGFILTDSSGVQYSLQGETSDLSSHVGEQVRIAGDVAPSAAGGMKTDNPDSKGNAAPSASTSSSAEANLSSITVKKVKKIASSCSTSAKSK